MANQKLHSLVSELDRNRLSAVVSHEFFKHGNEAFDTLANGIRRSEFSERQIANGLSVLFDLTREHCFQRRGELLAFAYTMMRHGSASVRTMAIVVAIRLASTAEYLDEEHRGLASRVSLGPVVRAAVDAGIEPWAADYVADFVSKREQ